MTNKLKINYLVQTTNYVNTDNLKKYNKDIKKETIEFSWSISEFFHKQEFTTNKRIIHKSFEKFYLKDLKALNTFLLDVLETNNLSTNDYRRLWCELNYKRTIALLEGHNCEYFCDAEYLYRVFTYSQKKDIRVGRLFPNRLCSYVYFPKEIIGFLLKRDEYLYFDIVNSHPTLLLEYVHNNMPNYSPELLNRYVTNRDTLLKEKSKLDKIDLNTAKKNILLSMNSEREYATTLGSYCLQFFEEVNYIREKLYNEQYVLGSPIFQYYKGDKDFHNKSLSEKKISVQNIYLQSQETEYICSLMLYLEQQANKCFLEERTDECLSDGLSMLIQHSKSYRDINPLNLCVSCIPFYDGVYIGSEYGVFKQKIKSIVSDFNAIMKFKHNSLVMFKFKKIDTEAKVFDPKDVKNHLDVTLFINSLSTLKFNKLLVMLGIEKISFEGCQDIQEMRIKSRCFRRNIYGLLLKVIEAHKLSFSNDNLYHDLKLIFLKDKNAFTKKVRNKKKDSDKFELSEEFNDESVL